MADSFIQIPADGVGKKVDTRTVTGGDHREVVVIGGPAVDTEVAPVSATLGLAVDPKTLPPDAATETTLAALNTKVTAVNTGAVVVASSALPSGASTSAKQDTEIASLGSLDTKILQQLSLDFDTGAGTQAMPLVGIALPASGGAVAGGTATNPLAVTGPLTDTQLRAADVKITLDGEAVVLGAGTAEIGKLAAGVAEIGNVKNSGTFAVQDAAAEASLSVIDDWDESGRAKVNPIVGQAGIAAGTGVDGATVPRVTLATNVGLPAGTALLGSTKNAGFQNASWATSHLPTSNAQATITQASAGGGIKNVCTGFTVTLATTATAPTAVQISVALIDGASGGTTYLWRSVISLPAVAGATVAFAFGNRWDVGTAATAMTLEFSGAGGANTIESVSMCGTTTL